MALPGSGVQPRESARKPWQDMETMSILQCFRAAVLNNSDDRTAKLWNPATGECEQTLAGHGGGVGSAVNFQQMVLLSGLLRLMELPSSGMQPQASARRLQCTQTLTGHGAVVYYIDCFVKCHCQALAFSNRKSWLLSSR